MPSREGPISGGSQAAAGGADRFAEAWRALRSDPSVQFNLAAPDAGPRPPAWLRAFLNWLGKGVDHVGRFLKWIASFLPDAPYARIVLWTVIALGAAGILYLLYSRIRYGEWRLRLPRRAAPVEFSNEEEWVPEEAASRSWLEEADELADKGFFAEAAHHLLFRSIEDIERRRPALVRPALTSREIMTSQTIPGRARELFSGIAILVERSLFGDRPVSRNEWLEARETYSDFIRPAAWRA
jgi:hypothetical protein